MLNILPKITMDTDVPFQTQKKKCFPYTQVYYTTQAFLSNVIKSGTDIVIYECWMSCPFQVLQQCFTLTSSCKNLMKSKEPFPIKKAHVQKFIAVLFIITKEWKSPKCPSLDEWIKKLSYIHNMEYHSAKKGMGYWHNMNRPWKHYAKWGGGN